MSKSQSFDHLKLIFGKIFNCTLYFQDHRTQLWYYSMNIARVYIDIKTQSIS